MMRKFILPFFLLAVRKFPFQRWLRSLSCLEFEFAANAIFFTLIRGWHGAHEAGREFGAASAQVPAAALSVEDDSTITKVVKLLQEMLDKSKEDGTNDRTVSAEQSWTDEKGIFES